MTPARFETIEEIFYAAASQTPAQRGAFLTDVCHGDEGLRSQVEQLLDCSSRVGDFIETPLADLTLKILENAQPELLVGQTIGHYELLERIGAGGMGEVYLARDIVAGRKAALKLLPLRFTGHPERLKRFEQEARAVVALNHPNIVTVYEIGQDHETHYIASELIAGETLRQRLSRGAIPLEETLEIATQVASALAAAHEAEIIHRDIKPENIMLRPDGYVKVLDFGIAKLTQEEASDVIANEVCAEVVETRHNPSSRAKAEGSCESTLKVTPRDPSTSLGMTRSVLGTARYMSPEQARGEPVSSSADIWSVGVVLYEMLSGQPPFVGTSAKEVTNAILTTRPVPLPSLSAFVRAEIQQIIDRTLRKEPGERYSSCLELIAALKHVRRRLEAEAAPKPGRSRPLLAAAATMAATIALAFYFYRQAAFQSPPEKSIAVLPFENLGGSKENSEFAAGIQDDVLTSLAQIHELKVISRTSVMAYQKSAGRNMREISRALGVANVLEGSVRRTGDHVLVNVQLIDARNDRHVWAERYDRAVADSIGLQGELATQIAAALKATLAPVEKARLDAKPTRNSEAYVLYLTALGTESDIEAEQLYMQATALDPGFSLAYARASILNSAIATAMTVDHRARKTKARVQAEEALRLSPNLGEAHMALGLCLYWGDKNYDAALKEFAIAATTSPNNAKIYDYIAGIHRRQGRWREAVASFEHAMSLDPRNGSLLVHAGNNYLFMRDWPAATVCYNRALEIAPDSVSPKVGLAYLEVFRNSNPAAGRKILQNIPEIASPYGVVTLGCFDLAMLERDYAAAEKVLTDAPEDFPDPGDAPKSFYQGRIALARGDIELAQRDFAAARPVSEERVREDPDVAQRHQQLGLLYAYMQRKDDAIRESRRAIELEPESENAFHGPLYAGNLALVYALAGEPDQAITLIERLLSTPGAASLPDVPNSITLAELRLRWEWDSLRSNPRFQKILAGPEPKTDLASTTPAAPAAPEKSIAVLPFENLSDNQQNGYFAAGIQDEILTDLARIADLKVVSRTSTSSYAGGQPRNSRRIGEELGVAHLLEGSVQRIAHRVRINAQLVDTRSDSHLWAQTYDRDAADIFAIQSEIAKAIAGQLQSRISQREIAAIAEPPTTDLIAHQLYLQAVSLESQASDTDGLLRRIRLLEQAVARDPRYLRAYCGLARLHLWLYDGAEHNAARLQEALALIDRAAQIQPDAGEVHLVRAFYLSRALRDYDSARAELELARRTLPNDPALYYEAALMDRRQGRWAEALGNFDRAIELDPRNASFLDNAAATYASMRRYARAKQLYRRALLVTPQDNDCRLSLAKISISEDADTRPLRAELDALAARDPGAIARLAEEFWQCAILERNAMAAERALAAMPSEGYAIYLGSVRPKEWYVGRTAQVFDRPDIARQAFAAACAKMEKHLREVPDDGLSWSIFGRARTGAGQKEQAIAAGRHACEVWPVSKEPNWGFEVLLHLAKIYAAVGEKDMAIQELSACVEQPCNTDYGDLKLNSYWDPLRGDPRFEKIVASLAPKNL